MQCKLHADRVSLPVTNATYIRLIDPEFTHLAALQVEAEVQIAISTQAALANLASCICVYPNETVNTSVPFGMERPATQADRNVVFPYLKAFQTPYDVDPDGMNCSDTAISVTPDFPFLWYGTGNAISCGNQYIDFDFSIGVNKLGYTTNCADPKSAQCANWEQLICTQTGNIIPAIYDYL